MSDQQAPQIMMQRPYHHGNLLLQLIWDPRLEIYSINIHRVNDRTDHDLWGIWVQEDHALAVAKFQSISL